MQSVFFLLVDAAVVRVAVSEDIDERNGESENAAEQTKIAEDVDSALSWWMSTVRSLGSKTVAR